MCLYRTFQTQGSPLFTSKPFYGYIDRLAIFKYQLQ